MEKIEKVSDLIHLRRNGALKGKTLGLVPTMGALHQGHLKLAQQSLRDNESTVVSIFVNQTQFNNKKDFQSYPIQVEEDLMKLKSIGIPYVFCPRFDEIYPDSYRYKLMESEMSTILCGAHRPGHFDGVLSVVLKLINISGATRSYFGEKDYQQLKLIEEMAQSFFVPTQVIGVPTVREEDGLAMSSRNLNLSSEARKLAPEIYKSLANPQMNCFEIRLYLEGKGFQVDYVEEHWGRRFVAASLEGVRLIDNVKL